jgi:hypothetical protein
MCKIPFWRYETLKATLYRERAYDVGEYPPDIDAYKQAV